MKIETRLALAHITLEYAVEQLQLISEYVDRVDTYHIKAVVCEAVDTIEKDINDYKLCNGADTDTREDEC